MNDATTYNKNKINEFHYWEIMGSCLIKMSENWSWNLNCNNRSLFISSLNIIMIRDTCLPLTHAHTRTRSQTEVSSCTHTKVSSCHLYLEYLAHIVNFSSKFYVLYRRRDSFDNNNDKYANTKFPNIYNINLFNLDFEVFYDLKS